MSRRSKIQAISVAFLAMTAGLFAETLEDARLKIVFGAASDGFAVRRIESRAQTTVAFLSSDASSATFWRLAFWKDGRAAEKSTLDNRSSARTRRVERTDSGLTFVWDGLDLPDEPNAEPGTTATCFAYKSFSANSSPVSPVISTDGKT